MSLGQYLLQGALDSTFTPGVNPAFYGVKNGLPVDKDGNAVQLYNQPNLFQRIVSPTAREYAERNATFQAAPSVATSDAINSANASRSAAEEIDPTLTDQSYAQTYDPTHFGPAARNAAEHAAAYGSNGTPGILGSTQAKTDITTAGTGLQTAQAEAKRNDVVQSAKDQETVNRLHQATNLDPLLLQHGITEARRQLGRDSTDQETLDAVSKMRNTETLFNLDNQNLNLGTQHNQDLIANYMSGITPQRGLEDPFIANVGQNGVQEMPGVNPSYANMSRMINAKVGTGGQAMDTDPSHGYSLPAQPKTITPQIYQPSRLIGNIPNNNFSDDYFNHASEYEPLSSNDNILYNPKTGRTVNRMTGQDMTSYTQHNPSLIHQIVQEQKQKQEEELADQEKVLKAKHAIEMDNLKRKAKQIPELPHGTGSILWNTLIGSARDSWQPFVNMGETLAWPAVQGVKLTGQGLDWANHHISGE